MLTCALVAALWVGATPASGEGFLAGPALRYPRANVFVRTAADLLALPAGVATWEHEDFAELAGWTFGVLALMTGSPSYDAQLQGWVHDTLGRPGARFTLHTPLGDALVWTATGVLFGTLGLVGWLRDLPPLAELFSLALEAFAIAELAHVAFKLLVGREGPKDGAGQGVVFGPAGGVRYFPSGTPSGHAAAFYALLGTVSEYVDRWWLTGLLQLVGAAFCASLIIDDYHFLSDTLWGAAMGWHTGVWVVRHRSSKGAPKSLAGRVQLAPIASVRPFAAGVLAGVSF